MQIKTTAIFAALVLGMGFLISFRQADSLSSIAFGSCNREDKEQPLWEFIVENKPNLWIWLGDNIYGDTDNMQVLQQKYARQKSNPAYQQLRLVCPVIGIWDDHDYGRNDAGVGYPHKAESQKLLLEFLDEPKESKRWQQKGAYAVYSYGSGATQVKVMLLD